MFGKPKQGSQVESKTTGKVWTVGKTQTDDAGNVIVELTDNGAVNYIREDTLKKEFKKK